MKKYVFQVTISEGYDEFWEELEKKNKTGCDELLIEIIRAVDASGFDFEVKLVEYKDEE